jgi:hypothetical protein
MKGSCNSEIDPHQKFEGVTGKTSLVIDYFVLKRR